MSAVMEETLKHVLGVLGTVLYVIRALPAAWQIHRSGRASEGGALGIDLLVISGVWWVAYSIEIDNVPAMLSSLAGIVPAALSLLMLGRSGGLSRRNVSVLALSISLLPLTLWDPFAVGVVAAASGAVIAIPEAVAVYRRESRLADVSVGTWGLVALNALVWLVYGFLVEHPILGIAGALQLPCALLICWRALRERELERAQPSASL